VPFADHSSFVTDPLQQLGESLLTTIELQPIIGNAVYMAVFASQNHRPAGRADRIRAEAVIEAHTFFGESVEVWRLVDFTSVAAQGV